MPTEGLEMRKPANLSIRIKLQICSLIGAHLRGVPPMDTDGSRWLFVFNSSFVRANQDGPQTKPPRDLTTPGRPEALMREG
jgi:hypothetical protein